MCGEEQGAKPPESSRQLKATPDSLESKLNVAFRLEEVEPSEGPEVIVAAGGVVSTVKDRDRTSLSFPGASIAWTENVWEPSESGGTVYVAPQALKASPSVAHWKVEPGSLATNLKVGVRSLVKLPKVGPEVILATGGVVSAVKLLKAL